MSHSKNTVFKPLLSSGGKSATIEEREIFIPTQALSAHVKEPLVPAAARVIIPAEKKEEKKRPVAGAKRDVKPPSLLGAHKETLTLDAKVLHGIQPRSPGAGVVLSANLGAKPTPRAGHGGDSKPSSENRMISRPAPIKKLPAPNSQAKKAVPAKSFVASKPRRSPPASAKRPRLVEESKKKPAPGSASSGTRECRLTEEEVGIYGNRFPAGYEKVALIGK